MTRTEVKNIEGALNALRERVESEAKSSLRVVSGMDALNYAAALKNIIEAHQSLGCVQIDKEDEAIKVTAHIRESDILTALKRTSKYEE